MASLTFQIYRNFTKKIRGNKEIQLKTSNDGIKAGSKLISVKRLLTMVLRKTKNNAKKNLKPSMKERGLGRKNLP